MNENEDKEDYEKIINREIAKFDINPFVVDSQNRVLLGKEFRMYNMSNRWHMPGGKSFCK